MNKSALRILLILLVGALMIAVALVLRDQRKPKNTLSKGQAYVLAADATGAVTLTSDGTLRGWERDGTLRWTQAPQYTKNAKGENVLAVSNAYCAGSCPAAYTNNLAIDKNRIVAHGLGGGDAALTPGPPLNANGNVVRAAFDEQTLLVRRRIGKTIQYQFMNAPPNGDAATPISEPVKVDADVGLVSLPSDDGNRALMLEIGTAKKSTSTTVRWFERSGDSSGDRWAEVGKPIEAKRAEVCLSGDGRRAALAAKSVTTMDFGGDNQQTLPIKAIASTCTFASNGITVFNPSPKNKALLQVSHFDQAGKRVWSRDFSRAAGFNARHGDNNLLQVTTNSGTEFISAATGALQKKFTNETSAIAAGSDVFVKTDSNGKPRWLP